MDPVIARKTWRTLEPLHGLIYFVPEAEEAYARIGLERGPMGYFASRAAAMGPVPAEVVVATFYNFNPALVAKSIPAAWEKATPAAVLEARLGAADRGLRRALGEEAIGSADLIEAARLARTAAEAAVTRPQGRPLFAAHAALPWPADSHLVLWHAQTLLREYRGDAHVAALLLAGLGPVEALVAHAATGEVPAATLRATRAWPDEEWSAAIERLKSRSLLAPDDELALSAQGREVRQRVEDQTDACSLDAYAALGPDGCERLRQLARPLSQAVVAGGLLAPRPDQLWL